MREALAAALAGRAALVFADDAGAVAAAVRAARRGAAMVLVVIDAAVAPLDRAMAIAAVGPLAAEVAPATRIAALDLDRGGAPEDAITAALFLAAAGSTTGQVLRISPRRRGRTAPAP